MARRFPPFYEEISDTGLAAYLKRILRIRTLSKTEEHRLAREIAQGDEGALRRLVEANLRFVVKVAMGYRGLGLSLSDLINEGNLGLVEAARRFSPEHDVKFITYAVWWIRQAILEGLARSSGVMRLPLRKLRLAGQIREMRDVIEEASGVKPTEEELGNVLELNPEEVERLLMSTASERSLEEMSELGDRVELHPLQGDQIPAADTALIQKSLLEEVGRMLDSLSPREREIIELRYGLRGGEPMTLEAVGRKYRLSRERVRQIEAKVRRKLLTVARARQLRDYLN
ncbi:MAG: RNA polymerase sigma factor RpoD/SigA [Candidatus Methylomirabilales bacterium]